MSVSLAVLVRQEGFPVSGADAEALQRRRLTVAARYLRAMFRPDDHVSLVARCERTDQVGRVHQWQWPLDQAVARLNAYDALNNNGWNVYVCVNPVRRVDGSDKPYGRTRAHVARVARVQMDLDFIREADGDRHWPASEGALPQMRADIADGVIPPPHFILSTSPGKFQCLWTLDHREAPPKELAEFYSGLLSDRYRADPTTCTVATVLRLPGYYNRKPSYRDAPPLVVPCRDPNRDLRPDYDPEFPDRRLRDRRPVILDDFRALKLVVPRDVVAGRIRNMYKKPFSPAIPYERMVADLDVDRATLAPEVRATAALCRAALAERGVTAIEPRGGIPQPPFPVQSPMERAAAAAAVRRPRSADAADRSGAPSASPGSPAQSGRASGSGASPGELAVAAGRSAGPQPGSGVDGRSGRAGRPKAVPGSSVADKEDLYHAIRALRAGVPVSQIEAELTLHREVGSGAKRSARSYAQRTVDVARQLLEEKRERDRRDFRYAAAALRAGRPADEVEAALVVRREAATGPGKAAAAYARRTVAAATRALARGSRSRPGSAGPPAAPSARGSSPRRPARRRRRFDDPSLRPGEARAALVDQHGRLRPRTRVRVVDGLVRSDEVRYTAREIGIAAGLFDPAVSRAPGALPGGGGSPPPDGPAAAASPPSVDDSSDGAVASSRDVGSAGAGSRSPVVLSPAGAAAPSPPAPPAGAGAAAEATPGRAAVRDAARRP